VNVDPRGHYPFLEVLRCQSSWTTPKSPPRPTPSGIQAATAAKGRARKESKSLTERMHQSGQVQQTDVSRRDAALLKAEAELGGKPRSTCRRTCAAPHLPIVTTSPVAIQLFVKPDILRGGPAR